MNAVNNLGNNLKEKMIEQAKKFEKWVSVTTAILKNSREVRNDVSTLNELDTALEDLKMVNGQVIESLKD